MVLELELVKRLVTEAIPDTGVENVRYISEGGDSLTFDVNGEYILKLPISNESSDRIKREAYILDFLKSRVSPYVPQLVTKVQVSGLYPYPYTVQWKIKGYSGEAMRPPLSNWKPIAATIGRILSQIHLTDVNQVSEMVPSISMPAPEVMFTRALRYGDLILGMMEEHALVKLYLNAEIQLPSESSTGPVLSHGDIKGEHIFLTEDLSDVSGIVDWADICLTDPVSDFTGFMIWLGPKFTEQVLNTYKIHQDAEFLNRIVFYSRCNALINLGENLAGETDSPRDLVLKQLRWAFSE